MDQDNTGVDGLIAPEAGDLTSAAQQQIMVDLLRQFIRGPGVHVDSLGVHINQLPPSVTTAIEMRWDKLDVDLAAGGSATVSLWEGADGEWWLFAQDSEEDIEAYAWPGQNGTIESPDADEDDVWVRVVKMGERWYVDMAPCPPTVEA